MGKNAMQTMHLRRRFPIAAETQRPDMERSSDIRPAARFAVASALLVFVAFLLLYRLDAYPTPWHDEGTYLHIAENYAENGDYADFSSEGNRYTGPVISIGPTVILPIAAIYQVTGVSIPRARLVIVLYSILTLIFLYGLTTVLHSRQLAALAVILAFLSRGLDASTSYVAYSRNVVGELPGLFFLFAGLWLWLRPGSRRLSMLLVVGLLFGLASITKNQYAIFILPSLLLVWILDMLWYKQRKPIHFIVPGIVAGLVFFSWTYYVLYVLGAHERDPAADIEALRTAGASGFFILDPTVVSRNFYALTGGAVYGGLFVPGLLWGIALSSQRNATGQNWGIITTLLLISSLVFVFSVGWTRIATPVIVISAIFVSSLLFRLGTYLPDWPTLRNSLINRELNQQTAIALLMVGVICTIVILPLLRSTFDVVATGHTDAYKVADFLDQNVPEDALIETWEEELSVLTDHNYHYPPQIVEAYVVQEMFLDGSPATEEYDFREEVNPDYLVIGPFSKWGGLYPESRLGDYVIIHSYGDYDIYARRVEDPS